MSLWLRGAISLLQVHTVARVLSNVSIPLAGQRGGRGAGQVGSPASENCFQLLLTPGLEQYSLFTPCKLLPSFRSQPQPHCHLSPQVQVGYPPSDFPQPPIHPLTWCLAIHHRFHCIFH